MGAAPGKASSRAPHQVGEQVEGERERGHEESERIDREVGDPEPEPDHQQPEPDAQQTETRAWRQSLGGGGRRHEQREHQQRTGDLAGGRHRQAEDQ